MRWFVFNTESVTAQDDLQAEMYRAEHENSADRNGNIKPCEPTTDSVCETSPAMDETYKYHTKIINLAWHLANVTTATLRQNDFNDDDIKFAELIQVCGDELFGLGGFLIDAAKTITEKVTVPSVGEKHDLVIGITNTDDESENDTALNVAKSQHSSITVTITNRICCT